ncbi:RagB/SusD family nutrient uptake outer membrane protein [Rapidithrix thailandica]|uniref:RagB/SusD family nutrient uptake outer membrane protein n=1 Tax=Rapidithrix thailandica TaxID=413964 RepID=A0AAW9RSJ2_9BACT
MRILKKITCLFALLIGLNACNYLDIVPKDISTLDDAFKRPNEALNFLYSTYSFMPNENDMFDAIGLWGTDEMVTPWDRSHYHAKRMMRGELNASSPFFDYWTTNGDIDMYDGIRQCYIFLKNIDQTPGFSEPEVRRMKGEVNFLIAYYHFILMRQYGPIVLMESEVSFNAPEEEFFPTRKPYDECVEFITQKFDEAIELLPLSIPSTEEGRITKLIAQSIKARMLLYAASPLFNGNGEFYSDFVNKDGTQLINTSFDQEKWKKAVDATKVAIESAEGNGVRMYEYTGALDDEDQRYEMSYRYSMVDPWNDELIWGYSIKEDYYGWQRHSAPRMNSSVPYNGQGASITMVETYYTENGLPIEVDPEYDYNGRYQIDGSTVKLHQHREPRFYASIAYDRGVYEFNDTEYTMNFMFGEEHGLSEGQNNYTPTGYLVKKGVHPQSIINSSQNTLVYYPWPLVRLAELYLNYAEALNEYYGEAKHTEVISYLNKIRTRSGIPTVQDAWAKVGKSSFTKDEMREMIRQERNIELAFEGHRVWDIRRWKLGEEYFNVPARGFNIQASTPEEFYQVINVETRIFKTPSYYLFPIRISELEKNQNLVQNPGW